jgi:hypothetical protein
MCTHCRLCGGRCRDWLVCAASGTQRELSVHINNSTVVSAGASITLCGKHTHVATLTSL